MTDPTRYTGSDAEADTESAPGIPGWLKVIGIAVIIVVLLVGAMMIAGGGGHQPPPGAH
ncbi:MAG: hypothetical protein M3406_00175 [Chloroflexota bacterium]|nr:hypothetical protein [Chloroflexota bacterium]